MAVPTVANTMGGRASIAINNVEIPSFMLGEITPKFEEGTRTRTTLAGIVNKPSGVFDTAELSFTFFPNQWDDLQYFFPEDYNSPTAPQIWGNVIFGGGTCTTRVAVPVNIHYECEGTDDRDIYIYAALARLTFSPTMNEKDDLSVSITLMAQPTSNGILRLGTGDLTEVSIYDPSSETTIPVAS
jgi:hypothetical protein